MGLTTLRRKLRIFKMFLYLNELWASALSFHYACYCIAFILGTMEKEEMDHFTLHPDGFAEYYVACVVVFTVCFKKMTITVEG